MSRGFDGFEIDDFRDSDSSWGRHAEKRRAGPAVWVFRWREDTPEGRVNRKAMLGTVEHLPTRSAALRVAEPLRLNITAANPAVPVTVRQLVKHYTDSELPSKARSTQRTVATCLNIWVLPMWGDYGSPRSERSKLNAGCVDSCWRIRLRQKSETSCTSSLRTPVAMNGCIGIHQPCATECQAHEDSG